MNFVIKVVKGIIIGLASLTAGAGTIAIVLRVYDRCMEIIAHPFKNFKDNLIYIAPIVLGIVIGAALFGNGILYLLDNYNSYVKSVFIGIVMGGMPALFKKANEKGYNKKYCRSLFIVAIIALILTFIGVMIKGNTLNIELQTWHLVIFGMIYGFGAIVPGMTTMYVLVFLGVVTPIIDGFVAFDMWIIIPFAIGYIAIVILFAKLISYCLDKHYGYTYYAIIGFAIVSLIMLIPEVKTTIELILCPLYAIIAAFLMYHITKIEYKALNKKAPLP